MYLHYIECFLCVCQYSVCPSQFKRFLFLSFICRSLYPRKFLLNFETAIWEFYCLAALPRVAILSEGCDSRSQRLIKPETRAPVRTYESKQSKLPPFDDRLTLIDRLAVCSIDDASVQSSFLPYHRSRKPPKHREWFMDARRIIVEGEHWPSIIHSAGR